MKIKLLKVHPNRWGEGKVHLIRTYPYTRCGKAPYGVEIVGDLSQVTCKLCLETGSNYSRIKVEV